MRLLVLDGSRVLHSLIRRLAPPEVEVESALAFEDAAASIEHDPPDAAIVNLTPSGLPWRQLKTLCQVHEPPIPVLFESCVYSTPDEAGLGCLGESATFLKKPYDLAELRSELERLLLSAGYRRRQPSEPLPSRITPEL
jgi:DNA-binding NtrC family response regulator